DFSEDHPYLVGAITAVMVGLALLTSILAGGTAAIATLNLAFGTTAATAPVAGGALARFGEAAGKGAVGLLKVGAGIVLIGLGILGIGLGLKFAFEGLSMFVEKAKGLTAGDAGGLLLWLTSLSIGLG